MTIEEIKLDRIGNEIAEELLLNKNKGNRYKTLYGEKTNLGLARTIIRILNDNNIEVKADCSRILKQLDILEENENCLKAIDKINAFDNKVLS